MKKIKKYIMAMLSKTAVIAISVLVIISSMPVMAMSPSQRNIFNKTIEYYNECFSGASGGTTLSDINGEDVLAFAALPIGSTWNLSDEQVETWFLGTGTRAIGKFNITADNIHEITTVVKEAGVSPMFFFGYTVNEGGGAGGYINHYMESAMTGDRIADAKKDAEYLVNQANSENSVPATGGGIDGLSTEGKTGEFLDGLPLGSIGKVYIPATSAATAEIATIFGEFDISTTPYGPPIQGLMSFIEKAGGDPTKPGVDISGGVSGSTSTVGVTCGGSQQLTGTANEKIVQVAKEWGTWGETYNACYVYGGGHGSKEWMDKAIENHFSSGYGVDCSAFVSAVIYKATGKYNMWSTQSMCSDTENFKEVSDPQPGDMSISCSSHVEVITAVNDDGSFDTVGSHSSGCGVHKGASPSHYKGEKVLRYIGEGSDE